MDFRPPPTPDTVKLNALLYGPPKTRKTTGACTLKRFGGVLLFNCDLPDATRFVRSSKLDPEQRIMEPRIPDYSEVDDQGRPVPVGTGKPVRHIQDLMRQIMAKAAELSRDPAQDLIKTVVVDPLGELYRRLLIEESGRAKHPTFDQRAAVTNYIEEFLRFLCSLPNIHVVIVCHELQVDRGGDEGLLFLPNTGTKTGSQTGLGPKLKGMVNVIAYTGVRVLEDGSKHGWAQLFPAGGRDGGDRFGGCLGDNHRLDLAEWVDIIQAYERGEPIAAGSDGLVIPQEVKDAAADQEERERAAARGDNAVDPSQLSTSQATNGSSGSMTPPGASPSASESTGSSKASGSRRRPAAKAKA